jgi:hypothetical protein
MVTKAAVDGPVGAEADSLLTADVRRWVEQVHLVGVHLPS